MNKKSVLTPMSKIPCTMTVEIGSATFNFDEISKMSNGSVYELNRLAGEPVLVKINGELVAEAEVVVVNEKFGVRLTDVMSGVGFEDFGPQDVA